MNEPTANALASDVPERVGARVRQIVVENGKKTKPGVKERAFKLHDPGGFEVRPIRLMKIRSESSAVGNRVCERGRRKVDDIPAHASIYVPPPQVKRIVAFIICSS